MAASKEDVLRHYQIRTEKSTFHVSENIEVPIHLREDIKFALQFVPYKVSEMAICENIIYPVFELPNWKKICSQNIPITLR
jgi:hypothetical protein